MMSRYYDVIVVGAGPAGAKAAEAISSYGVSVLIVDKRMQPGSPVQCAEYVPSAVRRYTQLVPGAVMQKIDRMHTYINGEMASDIAAPGYILDRVIFDRSLLDKAKKNGAEVCFQARAVRRSSRGIVVEYAGQGEEEILCSIIIGADGPSSTVGRWMHSQNSKFMLGLQYCLPLLNKQSSTDIYFFSECKGGYAWLFPKGEAANIGVGVNITYKDQIQSIMKHFLGFIQDKVLSVNPIKRTGGLIPVGGPLPLIQKGNMMLAGDAAGHTHPISGGGIMNAMVAGELAGKTAASSIMHKQQSLLKQYPVECSALFGNYLKRAAGRRLECDENWSDDSEEFTELIKRTWIGFPG